MRQVAWLLILAIPLRMAAQDIYTDEASTPPPMSDSVPLAKGGDAETSASEEAAQEAPAPAPKKANPTADVYTEEAASDDSGESAYEAVPVVDRPQSKAPLNTQGSSLYDEMEANYAKDMGGDDDDEAPVDEEFSDQKKAKNKKKNLKNKNNNKKTVAKEEFEPSHWHIGLNMEYANQFSHSRTNGYGAGLQGLKSVNHGLFVGAGILWNRFHESVNYDTLRVTISRTAKHFLIGPMMRYEFKPLAFDALVGWDRMSSQFTITDQVSGQNLNAALGLPNSGKYSESALGLAFRFAYSIDIDENFLLDFYTSYAIGFYTGESVAKDKKARMPQQLGLGALFWYRN